MAAQTRQTTRSSKGNSGRTRATAATKARRASKKAAPQRGLSAAGSGLLSQVDLLGLKSAGRVAAVSAALGAAAGALARPVITRRRKPARKISLGPIALPEVSVDGLKKRVRKVSKVL